MPRQDTSHHRTAAAEPPVGAGRAERIARISEDMPLKGQRMATARTHKFTIVNFTDFILEYLTLLTDMILQATVYIIGFNVARMLLLFTYSKYEM